MRKKIIRYFHIDKAKLERNRWARWLGPVIFEPKYWDFRRRNVAKGVFIGFFCAWLPVPIQVLIALVMALIMRANIPFAVGLVWIANPLTMPAMYYICYEVGCFLLQTPHQVISFQFSWAWFLEMIAMVWKPLILGSLICGLIVGAIGYLGVLLLWRYKIIKRWTNRKKSI